MCVAGETTSFARAAIGKAYSIALMRLLAAMCIAGLVACLPATKDYSVHDADAPDGGEPGAQLCFGTGAMQLCLESAPTMPQDNLTSIDTDTPGLCARLTSGEPSYCVVAATTFSIHSILRATGSRPLVLLASESITIDQSGTIDVGSHSNPTQLGAGHDPPSFCDPPTSPPTTGYTSGGGAGGSFATTGAKGGGGGGGAGGGSPAAGGPISQLRGGCAGQDGGGDAGGAGGHGGGAVFLVAGKMIDVEGKINAGGEGGKGGDLAATATGLANGGGGGGAGGMISFEAPMIVAHLDPWIRADGGGGGEASGDGETGSPGSDSYLLREAAPGGRDMSTPGGDGGAGSLGGRGMGGAKEGLTGRAPNGPPDGGGGGGGGGGAGVIIVKSTVNLGANVSPPATPPTP